MHQYKVTDTKMELDEEIEGFRVVAESLKRLGVKYMFGVVGIPVVEVNLIVHSFGHNPIFSDFV